MRFQQSQQVIQRGLNVFLTLRMLGLDGEDRVRSILASRGFIALPPAPAARHHQFSIIRKDDFPGLGMFWILLEK